MAGALRKTMEFLGLSELDEEYDYDEQDNYQRPAQSMKSVTSEDDEETTQREAEVTPCHAGHRLHG
ncbi:hypothetical protein [Ornithinimicrobium sp. INDO-MA30-4]|uniref:hypothetical protein n=1 Tax=Ornithinimicrobium sp. INDO-MA30-4 TaxID=2908651 RepID=UPI001F46B169|nr:hypothetical protein L0A91_06170 [Ornithinimicrobium sp. INDO-MA30-4]